MEILPRAVSLFLALLLPAIPSAEQAPIKLDGTSKGRTFEGIGAISAGASSRLLIDYPEPQRSEVLDYLFKPHYGAGFQHLKVEVGGDVNSTDGSEPSHRHTRGDENYNRGYEWWLMKEAKQRNPRITLDVLAWGFPAWVGNGKFHSQDTADYLVSFIKGAHSVHSLDVGYVGIWNEMPYNVLWINLLRRTLDNAGLSGVKIVAGDSGGWGVADVLRKHTELKQAIAVIGVHYPHFKSSPAAQACGKPLWSSEDGPWRGTWDGAQALSRSYNRNYVLGRMSKTEIWSLVTSYYDNLPLPRSGVMLANTPWSGHYEVQPAVWATAHTTQFAEPGWTYIDSGCAQVAGGSVVALMAPNGRDYSVIIETTEAKGPQTLAFQLAGGLSQGALHVWRSNAQRQFVSLPDLTPKQGSFMVSIEAGCIYSLTTTTGQSKGSTSPPPSKPFPALEENFESYSVGATPRYFADQAGAFEVVARHGGTGKVLRQVVVAKGIEWAYHKSPDPETFLGDPQWKDYVVSIDVLVEGTGHVSLFGRVGKIPQSAAPPDGYRLDVRDTGAWALRTALTTITTGEAPFSAGTWHNLRLQFAGQRIRALIDRQLVAETTSGLYPQGMVGIGSGWHAAQFDNLSVRTAP